MTFYNCHLTLYFYVLEISPVQCLTDCTGLYQNLRAFKLSENKEHARVFDARAWLYDDRPKKPKNGGSCIFKSK